jgi:hypothetical protein
MTMREFMHWSGPESFGLALDSAQFQVTQPHGGRTFLGRATSRMPKLYVVASGGQIVYVGVTRQPLRTRLRLGWAADGRTGYYGYQWRHKLTKVSVHVWYHENAGGDQLNLEAETVEAEVVYLVRAGGQWPEFQTEIHFHPSSEEHRMLASRIVQHCRTAS